jgi:hypothetical protein
MGRSGCFFGPLPPRGTEWQTPCTQRPFPHGADYRSRDGRATAFLRLGGCACGRTRDQPHAAIGNPRVLKTTTSIAAVREKPQLVQHRDERGRNWLHVCCATSLDGRDPKSSIRTADVLLAHGIDLRDHAFTEGRWRATPVWYCVAFGRNLNLAEHLMKLGASSQYALYAAAYNATPLPSACSCAMAPTSRSRRARAKTPFLGAIGWSHFEGHLLRGIGGERGIRPPSRYALRRDLIVSATPSRRSSRRIQTRAKEDGGPSGTSFATFY